MAKTLVAVSLSSEIDFVAVLVQQQFVIGFSLEKLRDENISGKREFLAGNSDQLIRPH
jgi:hypothetical protein